MKAIILSVMVGIFGLLIFNSCATIFTGTKQRIHFNSEPEGARIIVNGIEMGKTPTTISLNKPGFSSTSVTLRLKGYDDRTFLLDKSFNAVSILNFLGIVPWVVDIATGAFMNYSPEGYDYALEKKKRAELKNELGVDEIVFSSNLKKDANGLMIEKKAHLDSKVAVIDEKTGHVLVLQ